MPVLGDAVSRYHRLMERNGFGDTVWAEELQLRMRRRHLTDSGRLLSPVLRPCFVTERQVDALTKAAAQLSCIFDQIEKLLVAQPALLNKLQILPAEKSLFAVETGSGHFSTAGSFDTSFQGGHCLISGVDACKPVGLAYAEPLADVFLDLPIVKEFKRTGHKVSRLPRLRRISQSITSAWTHSGAKSKPAVAVVDWAHGGGDDASEGELLALMLSAQGVDARFVPPEKLAFQSGHLMAGDRKIDVVIRRILARELLTRWDLSHPLLEAYRSRAICMINSFRSEIGQRRSFLELLSDDAVIANLGNPADRKLLKQTIRWTRVVSQRKVQHAGQVVDLLDWTLKNREHLTLLPDQQLPELRSYAGSEMTHAAWEWALRQALRTPYVVQENGHKTVETYPFYQYGEFKLREVDVTIQAQVLSGELGDCTAVLHSKVAGNVTPLGIAPVLMVG